MFSKNKIVSLTLLFLLIFNNLSVLATTKTDIQAVQAENYKYPDYATMYVG